jgi:hypothetical protein
MNPSNVSSMFTSWRRVIAYPLAAIAIYFLFVSTGLTASRTNGFDLSDTLIPSAQIHHGGPPRDGIPAIDEPKFVNVDDVNFLADDDRILGMSRNGIVRAYPIRILNYHEIVNDKFGDEAVVVSFCPLCGTGMAFSAKVGGRAHSFGVSGLLYNSDVLLYDRETESLWSQIMRKAISGEMKGASLDQLALTHTTWRDWRERHPDTQVLSTETGHARNYNRSPYAGYDRTSKVFFPVSNKSAKYHPKELVMGLTIGEQAKVYPFAELSKGPSVVNDRFAGRLLRIEFDARNRNGRIVDQQGEEIPTIIAYWFAWVAFHPDTEVFEATAR